MKKEISSYELLQIAKKLNKRFGCYEFANVYTTLAELIENKCSTKEEIVAALNTLKLKNIKFDDFFRLENSEIKSLSRKDFYYELELYREDIIKFYRKLNSRFIFWR